jgi:hypothetical protein
MTTPAPQPAAPQPAPPLTEAEDKQWASFAHFGGVLGILPSLIIWLIFKDRGAKTNVEAPRDRLHRVPLLPARLRRLGRHGDLLDPRWREGQRRR